MSIWRRGFWRSYWIALWRSREDKRARTSALRVTLLLAFVLAEVVIVFILPLRERESAWQIAFYGFIFGTGMIAFVILRRSHRKQDEWLNYSLTGRPDQHPPDQDASPTVRSYLEERAIIIASVLARAGSEIYVQHNELPVGLEVATRQVQNELLRQNGLWDKLEPAESELVSAADGRWTVEQQNEAPNWCEQLRLLRWTFGVDPELMPLAHFPKVDFTLAGGRLGEPGVSLAGRPLLKSWDLRVERDIAQEYAARVFAELKGRGLIADSSEFDSWAEQFREESIGASVDYLAGTETIAGLKDESLRLLALIAIARERYAAYLAQQLSADAPFAFSSWLEDARKP